MSDIISRQGAIMHFAKVSKNYECGMFDLEEVTHELWEIPSAERKGEWRNKPNTYGVAYCSECDFELPINDTNYCPNCGASMVRGEEE